MEEYLLVLDADFTNSDKYGFIVKPVNNNLSLQWIKVYYPDEIRKVPQEIKTSTFTVPTLTIGNQIIKYLEHNIKKQTIKDGFMPMVSSSIPIVIQSYYIAKGQGYSEQSLYTLNYFCGINFDEYSSSSISFSNLMFINRLPTNDNPSNILNIKWDKLHKNFNWKIPNKTEERNE